MSWTKVVRPNWRLWCGNMLTTDDAISDGFSLFLRRGSDPKRFEKLAAQRSIYAGDHGLVLDTTGAKGLRLVRVYTAPEQSAHMHYLAELRTEDDTLVLVNAERLRNALLVAPTKGLWVGLDGLVYLTPERPSGTIQMFEDPPTPVGVIAPMEHPYRIMRRLEDAQGEEGETGGAVWEAGP